MTIWNEKNFEVIHDSFVWRASECRELTKSFQTKQLVRYHQAWLSLALGSSALALLLGSHDNWKQNGWVNIGLSL